jgi:chromosome segregation ATPase
VAVDYSYLYERAKSRYYEACSEITSCQNQIDDLKKQRQQKINLINQLKTDIKNHEDALQKVKEIIKSETDFNNRVQDISSKTGQAAVNYTAMIECSNVVNKNLNEVYGDEMSNTKRTINDIFTNLKAKRSELEAKIIDLKNRLKQAENELNEINSRITATQSRLQEWTSVKTQASYDMEYYRRKMSQAV